MAWRQFLERTKSRKRKMTQCASGQNHCLLLDPLASVWSCGNNQYGQLGLGSNTNIHTPHKINNFPPIISVSAGCQFSLFVDANGRVWSCGCNQDGRLGLGDQRHRSVPEQITNLSKIISTIALGQSSLFLDCEGSVWACGHNFYGQLGLGDTINRSTAEKIEGLPSIKSIAGGHCHSLFLDCEGSVWACGHNTHGNLGLGDTTHRNKAEKIQGLPAIKSIAGGAHWSMFVDEQGNVWASGWNQNAGLGLGHTTQINSPQKNNNFSEIVAVGGGWENYSVFLDNAGNIFTCGWNQFGQLGLGDKRSRRSPQKVKKIPPISLISSCNTAWGYLQIVDEEGRVWSCGNNKDGQLGLGHTNRTRKFQSIEFVVKLKQQNHKELVNTNNQATAQEPKEKEGAEWELNGEELRGGELDGEEKEMFKLIEQEQSKPLMEKLKSSKLLHNLNKQQAKQKIIEGVIGLADWSSKWKNIHAKNQQLNLCIQQHKVNLNNKQQQLDKLTQEVKEIKQALATIKRRGC